VIYHALPEIPAQGGHIQSTSHYQLFNLKTDPFESTDLSASEPAKLRQMMEGLIAQLRDKKAQYPMDKEGRSLEPVLPK